MTFEGQLKRSSQEGQVVTLFVTYQKTRTFQCHSKAKTEHKISLFDITLCVTIT